MKRMAFITTCCYLMVAQKNLKCVRLWACCRYVLPLCLKKINGILFRVQQQLYRNVYEEYQHSWILCTLQDPEILAKQEGGFLPLINQDRLRRILSKMLDENEFFGPHGIRSISKFHEKNPYVIHVNGQEYRVDYLPAESDSGMFGGNSNWRGPVWFPINTLIIRALLNFYLYYGDNFKIECPTGSGNMMNLFEVSKEITDRLTRFSPAMRMAGDPYLGAWRNSRQTHTGGTTSFFTSTSMVTMVPINLHRPAGPDWCPRTIQLYGLLEPKRMPRRAANWPASGRARRRSARLSNVARSATVRNQHMGVAG